MTSRPPLFPRKMARRGRKGVTSELTASGKPIKEELVE